MNFRDFDIDKKISSIDTIKFHENNYLIGLYDEFADHMSVYTLIVTGKIYDLKFITEKFQSKYQFIL